MVRNFVLAFPLMPSSSAISPSCCHVELNLLIWNAEKHAACLTARPLPNSLLRTNKAWSLAACAIKLTTQCSFASPEGCTTPEGSDWPNISSSRGWGCLFFLQLKSIYSLWPNAFPFSGHSMCSQMLEIHFHASLLLPWIIFVLPNRSVLKH